MELKHGLGWLEINLQRDKLLESACAELEELDPKDIKDKKKHFESFNGFWKRNQEWLGKDWAPCPQGDIVDEQEKQISQAN